MAHTGVWPAYQHIRTRRIAGLEPDGTVFDSTGAILGRHLGYSEVKNLALAERLDIYADDLRREHWADLILDSVDDPSSHVLCSRSGGIVAVTFSGPRRRGAAIAQAVSWDSGGALGPSLLAAVESVSALYGAGTYVSPGALGEAHWRRARRDHPPVAVPATSARRDLLASVIGGRADTPALGESFALAYESDMRSAYPALSVLVPTGTAGRMIDELDRDECATYYARCTVDVPSGVVGQCPIALPIADPLGTGRLRGSWVRRLFRAVPGRYTVWLWREEIEAARHAGLAVSVGSGWYWQRWDGYNRGWLAALADARRKAPDHSVLQLAKRAGVAAIGRHGMGEGSYELVTEEAADPLHDVPIAGVVGGSPIMGLWMHERDDTPPSRHLPHWYSFILMRCRLALYNRMAAEAARGNRPLMTNFDSVITLGPPTEPTTDEDEPGTWKQSELHELRIVAPRSYVSREKARLPGIRRG